MLWYASMLDASRLWSTSEPLKNEAMKNDTGLRLVDMRVDGGMTVNNLLMQMQVLWLSICYVNVWVFRILASEGHEGLEESKLFWLFVIGRWFIYVHFQFPKFPTSWDIELCEADALGMPVLRSKMAEATALGAALAAGLSVGFYHNKEQFWDNMKNIWKHMHRYAYHLFIIFHHYLSKMLNFHWSMCSNVAYFPPTPSYSAKPFWKHTKFKWRRFSAWSQIFSLSHISNAHSIDGKGDMNEKKILWLKMKG